jgi:molecular chaperone GrpE
MWAAITALTQEVKLQSRTFKQMSDTLVRDTERRTRKEVLDSLLEIRERQLRGLKSIRAVHQNLEALQPTFWDRLFAARWRKIRKSIEAIAAMEEGYRLGLQSLDDLLGRFQVRPIQCEGELFDPQLMKAVDIEETGNVSEGTVVSVYRTGYEWNGEVYRPAEVRVARPPQGGAIRE